jgi:two-component system chemotaxis sensor kinase CheA
VPAAKLDQFVDLVGELVTVQARLSEIAARCDDPEIAAVSEEVERLTSSLRDNSMNIRMMPIRATFEKFRRLVHDLARDLGKNVELTIEGADTELDKTVIDQLGDPLMHLIRNSMDHGIEPPAVRAERGKRLTATIHLSARHSGASVLIAVSDDGGGINAEAVRNRAIERGLVAGLTNRNLQCCEVRCSCQAGLFKAQPHGRAQAQRRLYSLAGHSRNGRNHRESGSDRRVYRRN